MDGWILNVLRGLNCIEMVPSGGLFCITHKGLAVIKVRTCILSICCLCYTFKNGALAHSLCSTLILYYCKNSNKYMSALTISVVLWLFALLNDLKHLTLEAGQNIQNIDMGSCTEYPF